MLNVTILLSENIMQMHVLQPLFLILLTLKSFHKAKKQTPPNACCEYEVYRWAMNVHDDELEDI